MIAPFVDQGASIRARGGDGSDGGVVGDDCVVDVLLEAALAALCALVETMMGMEGEVADWQQLAHNLLSKDLILITCLLWYETKGDCIIVAEGSSERRRR
jgi:hypothetical protein